MVIFYLNEPAGAGIDKSSGVLYTKKYFYGERNYIIPIDENLCKGSFNRIIRHRPNVFIRWGFLRFATPNNSLFNICNFLLKLGLPLKQGTVPSPDLFYQIGCLSSFP